MLKAKIYALQVKKGREGKRRNEKLLNMSTQKKLKQKRREAVKKRVADHHRHQKEAAKDNARRTI